MASRKFARKDRAQQDGTNRQHGSATALNFRLGPGRRGVFFLGRSARAHHVGKAASPPDEVINELVAIVPLWVCAVERRRFPVGVSPTRQPLQPEATGAVMEVTKWLKPLVSVSRYTVTARVCRP